MTLGCLYDRQKRRGRDSWVAICSMVLCIILPNFRLIVEILKELERQSRSEWRDGQTCGFCQAENSSKLCWCLPTSHVQRTSKISRLVITQPPLEKMTAVSQTMFSDAFSWSESFLFWLKFPRGSFLRVQLIITNIGLDNGLAPNRRRAIIWTNAGPIH